MAAETTVLIVDDHPLMRQGIRQSVESAAGLQVIGEAGDGKTALELVLRLRPKVVVLDISMPVMDGFALARQIRASGLPVEIVFLTAQADESLFDEALALGAKGYVLKDSAASDIVSSIQAAAAGRHYASPALTTYLVRGRQPATPSKSAPGLQDLTATEMKILRLVAEYKTTREIAASLFVSPLTVETHRRNICEKLGVRGSNALVKFALAHQDEIR